MPGKRKKMRQRKPKKGGRRESEKKNVKSAVSFNPNNYLETNILHLDQKAT